MNDPLWMDYHLISTRDQRYSYSQLIFFITVLMYETTLHRRIDLDLIFGKQDDDDWKKFQLCHCVWKLDSVNHHHSHPQDTDDKSTDVMLIEEDCILGLKWIGKEAEEMISPLHFFLLVTKIIFQVFYNRLITSITNSVCFYFFSLLLHQIFQSRFGWQSSEEPVDNVDRQNNGWLNCTMQRETIGTEMNPRPLMERNERAMHKRFGCVDEHTCSMLFGKSPWKTSKSAPNCLLVCFQWSSKSCLCERFRGSIQ